MNKRTDVGLDAQFGQASVCRRCRGTGNGDVTSTVLHRLTCRRLIVASEMSRVRGDRRRAFAPQRLLSAANVALAIPSTTAWAVSVVS